ncbi:ribokinase [Bacillus canaveralius]|uniref:ribokinase n=1 Tax=Bacillus canaveralius TaxID=1403243 RepID=UPI000F7A4BF6|nr:ribokinase [Bacillus canaveralius]RSK55640.1 ribokinase [Bacillus canaveralius]
MKPKITVIGSLNMDLLVKSSRFPNSGETILGESVEYFSGGKGANQAVAASRLGAEVTMIGAVGDDLYGDRLKEILKKDQVDISSIKTVGGESSGLAIILLENADNRIIVIQGANAHCTKEDIDLNQAKIRESDIILIQMEVPLETVNYAVSMAKTFNKTVILNPAPAQELSDDLLQKVDIITPNDTELRLLTNKKTEGYNFIQRIDMLLEKGVQHVVTTIGSEGSVYKAAKQELITFPAYQVPVVDTTGAGDCFNGALAFALGRGDSITDAIKLANKTAALSVSKYGAQSSMPTLDDVREFEKNLNY